MRDWDGSLRRDLVSRNRRQGGLPRTKSQYKRLNPRGTEGEGSTSMSFRFRYDLRVVRDSIFLSTSGY